MRVTYKSVIGVFFDTLRTNTLTWKVPVIVPSGKHASTTGSSISTCLFVRHSDNNVVALSFGEHFGKNDAYRARTMDSSSLWLRSLTQPTFIVLSLIDKGGDTLGFQGVL